MPVATTSATLLVLPPSHYCERARWALDATFTSYVEERLAVGLHIRRARSLAPKATLPILLLPNQVIQGSGAILDWTGMPGHSPETESRLEAKAGVLVRAFVYCAALDNPRSGIKEALFEKVPRRQASVGRLIWPVTRRLMKFSMNVRRERLAQVTAELQQELNWFADTLGSRHYLVGESFGRADLTAASLLSPILRLANPTLSTLRLPEAAGAALSEWRDHPAIEFARRMYGTHRRRPGPAVAPA